MTSHLATYNRITEQNPTLVGSGPDPDYPFDNALDGLTWTIARDTTTPSANVTLDFGQTRRANCGGIAAHNFDRLNNVTWRLQHSDDGNSWSALITEPHGGGHGAVFKVAASSEVHQYWRFNISWEAGRDNALTFGALWLGDATQMEVPVSPALRPPGQDYNNRLLQNFGGGGQLLGTGVLRQGGQTSYRFDGMTWPFWETDEMRAHYERLIAGTPFMLTWDNDGHADQAAYGVAVRTPEVSYRSHRRVDLSIAALTL